MRVGSAYHFPLHFFVFFFINLTTLTQDDNCRYNPRESGADDRGFVDVREGSEHALKKAIATVGPVSVAIDASHETFQFYHDGKCL